MSAQRDLDKHADIIFARLIKDVNFFELVKSSHLRDCVRDIVRQGRYENPEFQLDEMLVSANQTRYATMINGNETFLWCAFDAFLVAGLLNTNVTIAPCQQTGDREITIVPDMTDTNDENDMDWEVPLSVAIPVEFTGGPLCVDFCARSDFADEHSEVEGTMWYDFTEASKLAQAVLSRLPG